MGIDRVLGRFFVAAMICACMSLPASASGQDAFTYQGQLRHNGEPVAGPINFAFQLYDSVGGGNQVGPEIESIGFADFDDDGRFTIDLAFGKGLIGATPLWLEVRINGAPLTPRQPLMPAPVALYALDGNEGPQGEQGETGPAGPQGPQGASGPTGPTGPEGQQGIQGDPGPAGPQGNQGVPGPTGPQGPQGATGPSGPIGPIGPMGPSGVVDSSFTAGPGADPTTSLAFLSLTTVEITEPAGQRVFVVSSKALGSASVGGAQNLNLYIGFRPSGSTGQPIAVGDGLWGMRVPQNTRIPMTLSAVTPILAPGVYEVGLAGSSSHAASWNFNEWGYTSALVLKP